MHKTTVRDVHAPASLTRRPVGVRIPRLPFSVPTCAPSLFSSPYSPCVRNRAMHTISAQAHACTRPPYVTLMPRPTSPPRHTPQLISLRHYTVTRRWYECKCRGPHQAKNGSFTRGRRARACALTQPSRRLPLTRPPPTPQTHRRPARRARTQVHAPKGGTKPSSSAWVVHWCTNGPCRAAV